MRIPMGLKPATNWAQATMFKVFIGLDPVNEHFFIEMSTFDTGWNTYVCKVNVVLECLKEMASPLTNASADGAGGPKNGSSKSACRAARL
jgi:hypothetical protein